MTFYGVAARMTFLLAICAFACVSTSAKADIGSISVEAIDATHARVSIEHSGYWVSTQHSPNYRVCWKLPGQGGVCHHNKVETDTNPATITVSAGTTYKIHVECYCSNDKNSLGWLFWRNVADTTYTHTAPVGPPPLPTLISSTRARVRHVNTSQCMFADGTSMKHWQCWNDTNQAFNIERYVGGMALLRHVNTGRCLYASSTMMSIFAGTYICGYPETFFKIIDVNGDVRLQTPNGRCLSGDSQNGNMVLIGVGCNDSKFNFHFDQ